VARPSKFTPERQQRILTALSAGNTRKAACEYAGVEQHTFQRWLLRYVHFAQAVTRAEGDAEVRMMALVHQAAPNDWRAAAWWLERRRSSDYGRRDKLELDIREMASRYADQVGVDVDTLIAEAERIVRGDR